MRSPCFCFLDFRFSAYFRDFSCFTTLIFFSFFPKIFLQGRLIFETLRYKNFASGKNIQLKSFSNINDSRFSLIIVNFHTNLTLLNAGRTENMRFVCLFTKIGENLEAFIFKTAFSISCGIYFIYFYFL